MDTLPGDVARLRSGLVVGLERVMGIGELDGGLRTVMLDRIHVAIHQDQMVAGHLQTTIGAAEADALEAAWLAYRARRSESGGVTRGDLRLFASALIEATATPGEALATARKLANMIGCGP